MKCVMCSNADSSVLKLQTYVNNNTLKEITFVLPDFEIPATQGPVYVCVTCEKQVATFYTIKKTSLESLYHLNHYEDILKTTSDVKFNYLKITLDGNKIPIKHELTVEFENNPSCKKLTVDKEKCKETDSNLTSNNKKPKKQLAREQKPFKCSECNKAFTSRGNLEVHTRVHTGERPYKCQTCQKTFTTSSILNTHLFTHTGEKPHECDVCHKKFAQKSKLIMHIRSHTNVRPYSCTVCTKAFTQSSHLISHMRIHTGDKPHHCHICPYKSTRAGNLRVHLRTHGVIDETKPS